MPRRFFREIAYFLIYCVVVFSVLATIGLVMSWWNGGFDPSRGGSPEQFQHILYVRWLPILFIAGLWWVLRAWFLLRRTTHGA